MVSTASLMVGHSSGLKASDLRSIAGLLLGLEKLVDCEPLLERPAVVFFATNAQRRW
jgi:hypothetical protein